MQAVILAAGIGSRMKNFDNSTSKHMFEIAKDKPILAYTLDILPKEVDHVIMVVNYLKEHIQKYFGDEYKGRKISYVFQKELKGTGWAVKICKDLIKDDFLVVTGDDLFHPDDIKKVAKYPGYCLLVQEAKPYEEIKGGVVEIDKNENVTGIVDYPKDPKSRLLNTAVYKLKKNFFDYPLEKINAESSEYGLPQTLAKIAKDHPVKTIRAQFWQIINTPEELGKARAIFPKLKRDIGM